MVCNCHRCSNICNVRSSLEKAASGLEKSDSEVLNSLAMADKLLVEALVELQRVHQSEVDYDGVSDPQGMERPVLHRSSQPQAHFVAATIPMMPGDKTTPTRDRQLPDPSTDWDLSRRLNNNFQNAVRAKANELGILRQNQVVTISPPKNGRMRESESSIKEKTQFIVCDHCRSHGISCNEASVCKECILRQVPCTHRQCDLSPSSRVECPRQVCFYVHSDWMPDMNGMNNPGDPNWVILPGKLRERLSAGQLARLAPKDEAEIMRCYRGVARRQLDAVNMMKQLVHDGMGTWESVAMSCSCIEIEREQGTRVAEEGFSRITLHEDSGSIGYSGSALPQ